MADYLLLLDEGRVAAFDTTEKVWQSEAFKAWQPQSQKVSLLELPIVEENPSYGMVALGLGEQRLWFSVAQHYQQGEKVRVTINSRDVSMALEKPNQSSIRNVLFGTVCKIQPQNDRLDIAVNVAGQEIWASISRWAFEELGLVLGQEVYLQVKSVSL